MNKPFLYALPLLGSLAFAACTDEHDPTLTLVFRDAPDTTAPPARPSGGGYINNGLHDPQIGGIDPAHPLDTLAGLDGALLDDPDRLATAQHLVECALPSGVTLTKLVDGVPVDFDGALGLAPEWEDEPCEQDCQEWVSACLLARTNVSSNSVALRLVGEHPELGSGPTLAYPVYEASFFGNLFADDDAQYMCQGPLVGPLLAQLEGRTCAALVGGYCDMTPYLLCNALPLLNPRCDFAGLLTPMVSDCRPGASAGGPGMRTISSYVHLLP
jgi:hypothetical protein